MRFLMLVAALAALVCGCVGGGEYPNSDTNYHGTDSGTVIAPPVNGGSLKAACTLDGSNVETQVLAVSQKTGERFVGLDNVEINLEPGVYRVTCGNPDMTTLDGVPFYVHINDDYYTGVSKLVTVVEDEVTITGIPLVEAMEYYCASWSCDDGTGSSCENFLVDINQVIYVEHGVVYGSETPAFTGGSVMITMLNGEFNVESVDPKNVMVIGEEFDPVNLSFGYIKSAMAAGTGTEIYCSL